MDNSSNSIILDKYWPPVNKDQMAGYFKGRTVDQSEAVSGNIGSLYLQKMPTLSSIESFSLDLSLVPLDERENGHVSFAPILTFQENTKLLPFSLRNGKCGSDRCSIDQVLNFIRTEPKPGPTNTDHQYLKKTTNAWRGLKDSEMRKVFEYNVVNERGEREKKFLLGYKHVAPGDGHSGVNHYIIRLLNAFRTEINYLGFHFGVDRNNMDIDNCAQFVTVFEFNMTVSKSKLENPPKMENSNQISDFSSNSSLSWFKDKIVESILSITNEDYFKKDEDMSGVFFVDFQPNQDSNDLITGSMLVQYLHPCPPFGNCEEDG